MIADPLRRVPDRMRVGLAGLLCLAPLGSVWSVGAAFQGPGSLIDGDCGYDEDTYVCNPTEYVPGAYQPGHATLVSQSPARVFLVAAAIALAVVAVQLVRGPRCELVMRAGVGGLVAAGLEAAVHGAGRVVVCVLLALALVAPLVRTRREVAAAS